jgi:acyl carrier protein
MKDRVFTVMSSVFNVPVESLNDDSSFDTIDQWNSLQHMNLIFALEEEFGVTMDDEVVAELTSVKGILDALEKAG